MEELGLAATLARYWEAGGWPMYPIFLLGLLGLLASVGLPIAGFAMGKPRPAFLFAMMLLVLAVFTAGMGALGQTLDMRTVDEAIVHVNPADREIIRMAGSSESRTCLAFGLYAAILPLAAAGLLLSRALARAKSALGALAGPALAIGLGALCAGAALQQGALVAAEDAAAHQGIGDKDLPAGAPRPVHAVDASEASARLRGGAVVGAPFVLAGIALLVVGAKKREDAQP